MLISSADLISMIISQCRKLMVIRGTLLFIYFIGFQFDYVFDWTILKYQQSQISSAPPRTPVSNMHSQVLLFSFIFFFCP